MTYSEWLAFRNFLTSTGMHVLLFLAALFWFLHQPKLQQDAPISVDVIQYPKFNEKAPTRGLGRPAKTKPAVSLDDLGLKTDTRAQEEQKEESSPGDAGGWDLENENPTIARFNQYVYTVVQRQLDLESRWIQDRLRGTVKIRIWFDENGNYLTANTVYDAIDARFQHIVERALKQAFVNPIPHPYLYSKKTFYIDREVFVRATM